MNLLGFGAKRSKICRQICYKHHFGLFPRCSFPVSIDGFYPSRWVHTELDAVAASSVHPACIVLLLYFLRLLYLMWHVDVRKLSN